MKKRVAYLIIGSSVSALLAVGFIAYGANSEKHLALTQALVDEHTLTLTKNNDYFTDGTHVLDEYQTIHTEGVVESIYGSNLGKMAKGGFIEKVEASKGLSGVRVDYVGNIRVVTWFSGHEDEKIYYYPESSKGDYTVIIGDFWRLEALSEAEIGTISFKYNCYESTSSDYATEVASTSGVQFDMVDGELMLSVGFSAPSYKVSDLSIVDDHSNRLSCYSVTGTKGDLLAHFDLSPWVALTESPTSFSVHLQIKNAAWDGDYGNVNKVIKDGQLTIGYGDTCRYDLSTNEYTAVVTAKNFGDLLNASPANAKQTCNFADVQGASLKLVVLWRTNGTTGYSESGVPKYSYGRYEYTEGGKTYKFPFKFKITGWTSEFSSNQFVNNKQAELSFDEVWSDSLSVTINGKKFSEGGGSDDWRNAVLWGWGA